MNMIRLHLVVELHCESCVKSVENALKDYPGIKDVVVNLDGQEVTMSTNLPSFEVIRLIQLKTGKKAFVHGQSRGTFDESAVAAFLKQEKNQNIPLVEFVVRFIQIDEVHVAVDATLNHVPMVGIYKMEIHQYGDISSDEACGKILYDQFNPIHVTQLESPTLLMDIAPFSVVQDIIGKSFVLVGEYENESKRVGMCVIARSAGFMQNFKKVCKCDPDSQ